MKLIDQCCTLVQAKNLKALGVIQDAIWFWAFPVKDKMISTRKGIIHYTTKEDVLTDNEGDEFDHDVAAAFTVAELGVMLPDYIVVDNYRMHLREIKQEQNNRPAIFSVTIGRFEDKDVPTFTRNNEAIVRAELLIHLLENKLITAEEVNKRLICPAP